MRKGLRFQTLKLLPILLLSFTGCENYYRGEDKLDIELKAARNELFKTSDEVDAAASDARRLLLILGSRNTSSCNDDNWKLAEFNIFLIEGKALIERAKIIGPTRMDWLYRDTHGRFYREFSGHAIRFHFDLADVALEKECLDLAEKHYRAIITEYPEFKYLGYQDRAKIGLEDVGLEDVGKEGLK